jgi:hypothetical protein
MCFNAPLPTHLLSAQARPRCGVPYWRAGALLALLIVAVAGAEAGDVMAPIVTPPAFPAFIGDHDRERLLLGVANPGNAPLILAISFGDDVPALQTITLRAREKATATIELHVGTVRGPATRVLEVHDDRGMLLYRQRLVCLVPNGDLAGLRWNGHGFVAGNGDPAVLVTPSLDGSEQRRWGLLRSIEGNPLALGDRVILWTNVWSPSTALADLVERIGKESSGKAVTTLAYAGDPAAAILETSTALSATGPAVICLAWGNEEAYQRRPVKDLRNALIIAARRIQHANPQHRVLLVTPLPLPGETQISEPYAQAVRDAGQAAELRVVDWHALILAQPQWEALFLVDGDPAIGGRFPATSARALLAHAIAEGLQR